MIQHLTHNITVFLVIISYIHLQIHEDFIHGFIIIKDVQHCFGMSHYPYELALRSNFPGGGQLDR